MKIDTKYDLEDRTATFAEETIELLQTIPFNSINKCLIDQCMRSAGSVGANYCEANEAESKKDFIHKISICKKEVKETKHWLRLIAKANHEKGDQTSALQKEAQELLLIFSKIIRSSKKPNKQ